MPEPNATPPPSPLPVALRLMDYREVAATLGVSQRTVHTLVKTGKIKVVRILRSVRFAPEDVRAYIAQAREATP